MSNDRPDNPIPDQTGNNGNDIAVDDMGIPILEEIIPDKTEPRPETHAPAKTSSDTLKRALTVPNNEILANALRNQLRSKVKKNLDDIAQDVAAKAVSGIASELEQRIRNQLTEVLDQNLDEMIEKVITEIPKRI